MIFTEQGVYVYFFLGGRVFLNEGEFVPTSRLIVGVFVPKGVVYSWGGALGGFTNGREFVSTSKLIVGFKFTEKGCLFMGGLFNTGRSVYAGRVYFI